MSFIYNQKVRGVLFQLLTIVGFVAFLWYITNNMFANIEQRGINTGFEFLDSTAGFVISESPIEYNESSTYGRAFLVGLANTLIVSFVGIIFASLLGLLIGVARLSSNWLISKLALVYIEFFRNIPILLQILFWYNVVLSTLPGPRQSINFVDSIFINNRGFYFPKPIFESAFWIVGIAIILVIIAIYLINRWANRVHNETGKEYPVLLIGILLFFSIPLIVYLFAGSPIHFNYPELKGFNFKGGINLSPEFLALTFALSIYTATYIAEAIRAGIEAVPKGQKEAAESLGLTKYQELKFVVLPQAIRIAIPPIINQYLNLTKNSSLAAAIGYPELVTVFAGTVLNQVGQAVEIIVVTMAVYLVISIFISLILNWFNAKMKLKER